MKDIFDNTILCENCNSKMEKSIIEKNGFSIRVMACPNCHAKILHPGDLKDYENFINLKNKTFKVKLRLVGNSYAVSIPKEIVHFMQEQKTIVDDMVRLCFDDFKKISLLFNEN